MTLMLSDIMNNMYSNTLVQTCELMVGAIFAGYLVADLPPEFLNLFQKPIYQFGVVLLIFNQNFKNTKTHFIIFYAVLFTITLKIFKHMINEHYKKTDKE